MLAKAINLTSAALRLRREDVLTRWAMYDRLANVLGPLECGSTLNISDSDYLTSLLGKPGEIVKANYPACSITDLPFPDGQFDAIVADQVLEHVDGTPERAIGESFRVVKAGGYVIHTTCLLNPVHGYPSDFMRFTPGKLQRLVEAQSEVVEVGGWGTRLAMLLVVLGLRSVVVPEARWHPINWIARQKPDAWLIHTWVVARKR